MGDVVDNDDQTAIRQLYERNAELLSGGVASALAPLYAQDAIQLPPVGEAVIGWDAICQVIQLELAAVRIHPHIEVLETIVTGDWAIVRGRYRMVVTPQGG